jgi:hypothetical protein
MMAFFVTTPISIRMPITTGIEIGRWASPWRWVPA